MGVIRAMDRPSCAHASTSFLVIAMTVAMTGCGLSTHPASSTAAPGSSPGANALTPVLADPERCAHGVADVTTYRGDAARTGRMPAPSLNGSPAVAWSFEADGPLTSSPVLLGGDVFQGSASGTLYAFDLVTGAHKWTTHLGAAVSSPTELDGRLVVGLASGGVAAVDPDDGSVAWTRRLAGESLGAPTSADGGLIVASTTGVVTQLQPRTGAPRWTVQLEGRIARTPAVDAGVVVVPIEPGALVTLDADTGRAIWRAHVAVRGGVGTPTIAEGLVLTATGLDTGAAGVAQPSDRAIVAVDLASGQRVWRWATGNDDVVYSPAVSGGRAFVVDEGAGVTALDVHTGREIWHVVRDASLEAVAAVAGDSILVVSNGGSAASLAVATGAADWAVPIHGVPYGPVVSCGWVVVPTNLGGLTVLRVSR